MSKFDLSNAQSFQAATLGSAAGILQTIALLGRDPTKWDLVEGAYSSNGNTPVLFHIFKSQTQYQAELPKISDRGGRRKAKYKFPYKDGQTTDDLGREPESFDIEVLFHGPKYLQGFTALKAQLDNPKPGTLIHPVRGNIPCVAETYEITHESDQMFALTMRVTFIEHNFTIGTIRSTKDTSVKGFLSSALSALSTVQNAITNVIGVALFANSLKNQITQALTNYQNQFGTTLSNLNSVFNTNSSTDIPGLVPVNNGGNINPDGTLANTNFLVATSPNSLVSSATLTQQAQTALAVKNVTNQVIEIRQQLSSLITLISSGAGGLGALLMYNDILNLKNTAIQMQYALEAGIASSNATIVAYTVPIVMSLREVAFANGLNVDRVTDLNILNPDIDSTNYILPGTIIQVPTS